MLVIYWLPNIHKTPICVRFVLPLETVAQSNSKSLKIGFTTVENFHSKSLFYSD